MLELTRIREHKDEVIAGLKKRMWKTEDIAIVDKVIRMDDERKELQTELDAMLAESNKASKEIGALYGQGKREEAEVLKNQISQQKDERKALEEKHNIAVDKLSELLYELPNIPADIVIAGAGEEENEVAQDYEGKLPELDGDVLPHWELADKYNLMSLELGVKITGAGFPLFMGNGARMQRALINLFLDKGREAGFIEMQPPILVNEESARGTGQLPDKEGQMYYINEDNLYLIPTAEVPLTNVYRDVIFNNDELPIKITGYTPSFRREAGSYGAHVKGLNRVHQFDKVEIVQITKPEDSMNALEEMCNHVAELLDALELPYRILRLCAGDTGFASAITYDFEVYSVVQKRWLEVSSVSNFNTFQSNRMKIRYRDEQNKTQLAHTLNGSALALPRILAGLWELNQTEQGIKIPKVLQPYMGGMELIQ